MSVVVPAWNVARTIGHTLRSVLGQVYPNLEVIVIDDGSTDDTPRVVAQFVREDPRIRMVRQENAGVAAARNRGVREARGKYVAPIDADDVWEADNLARQVSLLEASEPPAAFCYAASYQIDAEGRRAAAGPGARRKPVTDYAGLLRRNCVGNGSAAVYRREALPAAGGYDESMRGRQAQGAEDWKLILKLAAQAPVVAVADQLVGYRQLPDSMSMDPETMTRSMSLVIDEMRRAGPRVPPWHYWHSRTSMHTWMFYRWIAAGRPGRALSSLAWAYLANPLWFTQKSARDFLITALLPHVFMRIKRAIRGKS